MEEQPHLVNNLQPRSNESQVTGLPFRYELPNSEPLDSTPLLTREKELGVLRVPHNSVLLRPLRESTSVIKPEETPETIAPPELTEAQFDSRHEIVTDDKFQSTRMAEGMVAIGQVLENVPKQSAIGPSVPAPIVPPPLYSPTLVTPAKVQTSGLKHKKPIVFGLIAGIITGVVLIALFFS